MRRIVRREVVGVRDPNIASKAPRFAFNARRGVRGRGGIVMGSEKLHLPPGYRLDRSDPDVWTLRRPEGWVVAYFSARGATKEAIEEAWEDHEGSGDEEYA